MTRLLVLVEGQSEEIFVKNSLGPFLASYGVFAIPSLLWTKRVASGGGFRGGVSHWNQIRKSLLPLTRDTDAWVTTLLDYYGLPEDFPGRHEASLTGDPRRRVVELQRKFEAEVSHVRFIAFLALHEFEAWIFSDPSVVAQHFGDAAVDAQLRAAVTQAGEPELIDEGIETHPKARLQRSIASYKETSDGPTILQKIGIGAIRNQCPHFAAWLTRLVEIR